MNSFNSLIPTDATILVSSVTKKSFFSTPPNKNGSLAPQIKESSSSFGAKSLLSPTVKQEGGASPFKTASLNLNNKVNGVSPKNFKTNSKFTKGKTASFPSRGKRFPTGNSAPLSLKIKRVLSLSQILGRIRQQRHQKLEQQKRQKPIKPIIPPKSLIIVLKDKPEKILYNRRIIDYRHCGLLLKYLGIGGKILPRRQTRLTAKQQRYVAKIIKSARIMGLLPFVSKERGFFR